MGACELTPAGSGSLLVQESDTIETVYEIGAIHAPTITLVIGNHAGQTNGVTNDQDQYYRPDFSSG